jgi:hypothetical protein
MKAEHARQLWVPVQGELMWVPYETKPRVVPAEVQQAKTVAEFCERQMREALDVLTDTFVELYLEANPNMARVHGHA